MDEEINETMIALIESIQLLTETVIELNKSVIQSNKNRKPKLVIDNDGTYKKG